MCSSPIKKRGLKKDFEDTVIEVNLFVRVLNHISSRLHEMTN